MDSDLEFNMHAKAKGHDLYELVCKILGIRESWYFDLRYIDKYGQYSWLKLNKKVIDQCPKCTIPFKPQTNTKYNPIIEHNIKTNNMSNINKEKPKLFDDKYEQHINDDGNGSYNSPIIYSFEFLIKLYPEDVEEIIQANTLHLFFLQILNLVLNMDIYCPPEASVLLASYSLQAKYGDYQETMFKAHNNSQVISELPVRVLNQYQMTESMWEERIETWYIHHKGMNREEAELEYLKIVQDLDMYGIQYFDIHNKKKTELWLGVSALGLNIYEKDNKLSPKIFFPWNEISTVSMDIKKFTIKLLDKNTSGFVFYVEKSQTIKLILELCVRNHDLFLRRRKCDSLEIQQMKNQAKEERARKQIEKANYMREQQQLEEVQKIKKELELQLDNVKKENDRINQALKKSKETTELLVEKSKLAQEESYLLAFKAKQSQMEIEKLRSSVMLGQQQQPQQLQNNVNINPRTLLFMPCNERLNTVTSLNYNIGNNFNNLPYNISSNNAATYQNNTYFNNNLNSNIMNNNGLNEALNNILYPAISNGCNFNNINHAKYLLPNICLALDGFPTSPNSFSNANYNINNSILPNGNHLANHTNKYLLNNSNTLKQHYQEPSFLCDLKIRSKNNSLVLPISNDQLTTPSYYNFYRDNFSASHQHIGDAAHLINNLLYNVNENNPGNAPTTDNFYRDFDFMATQHQLTTDKELELLNGQLEKERTEYLEKCKTLRYQLQELRKDFETLKVVDKESPLDRIHAEAQIRGDNKYSTLKKVKIGTMKSRVAFFEEL
ncbi:merlin-like isoform X1 [Gordionus sp. m RMFG-2023]|uniref:merlin-like isoform X1 n=1 Tax=Gordionus sp. m RMFG-2023 TaxID=3053472 RepID=UPI0031FC368C